MSGLRFAVTSAEPKRNAASPAIVFALDVQTDEPVEALVLRVQLNIEPQWRAYEPSEKPLLSDLFGEPERWGTTLRSFAWADVSLTVPGFDTATRARVSIPCTYDFDVTATRFFHALGGGEIPLRFLFSGAIFKNAPAPAAFSTERIPWSSECAYRLPLGVWHAAMRECYGDDALVRVSRETLDALHRLRSLSGATTWDALLQRMMVAET